MIADVGKASWWLSTDPCFEQTYVRLCQEGFVVSVVARDEFEETLESGLYQLDRTGVTLLGSRFDMATDMRTMTILVTADPPGEG